MEGQRRVSPGLCGCVGQRQEAVALVIYDQDRQRVLVVKRPPQDDRLPNVWGLPAVTLQAGESYQDAALRAGPQKLGVQLRIVREIAGGTADRGDHVLHMKEFEAEILAGTPCVPQPIEGITQYVAWKWGAPDDLVEAHQMGSLCCRLFLSSIGRLR